MQNFTVELANKIEEYIGDYRRKFDEQVTEVRFI